MTQLENVEIEFICWYFRVHMTSDMYSIRALCSNHTKGIFLNNYILCKYKKIYVGNDWLREFEYYFFLFVEGFPVVSSILSAHFKGYMSAYSQY